MKKVLIIIIVFLIIYVLISLHISLKVNYLVNLCYNTHGNYTSDIEKIINKEDFEKLNYRDSHPPYEEEIIEKNSRTFPITFHLFFKGTAYYIYTFESYSKETGEGLAGSYHAPVQVKVELKNWKWIVTDVHEEP